jgi:hypothetical protein
MCIMPAFVEVWLDLCSHSSPIVIQILACWVEPTRYSNYMEIAYISSTDRRAELQGSSFANVYALLADSLYTGET